MIKDFSFASALLLLLFLLQSIFANVLIPVTEAKAFQVSEIISCFEVSKRSSVKDLGGSTGSNAMKLCG